MSQQRVPSNMRPTAWGNPPSATGYGYGSPDSAAYASSWGTVSTGAPLPKNVRTPTTISFNIDSPRQSVASLSWNPAYETVASSSRGESVYSENPYSQYAARGSPAPSSYPNAIPRHLGPGQPSRYLDIIPALRSGSVSFCMNLSDPPTNNAASPTNYHPSMEESAFRPTMTYARITIVASKWTWNMDLHAPEPLTMLTVLYQIYNFLQQPGESKEALSARMASQGVSSGDYRDQNTCRSSYGGGVKRINLSPCRYLQGFSPAQGDNHWIVYLCPGPQ